MNSRAAAGGAAAARTGMSDARSAGSSEARKSAGRDEGGTVCAHQFFFAFKIEGVRHARSGGSSVLQCPRQVCDPMRA